MQHAQSTRSRLSIPVLAASLAAGCQVVPSVVGYARYAPRDISGDALVSSSGASAKADVDDMGLKEDDSVFEPRVDVAWANLDLTVSGYEARFEGDGTLDTEFTQGGTTITAGDMVTSDLKFRTASALATFDLVPTDLVDVGVGVGAAYFDLDLRTESLTTSETIQTSEKFIMPVLAARAQVEVGPFRVNVTGSGLTGKYQGVDGTYFDLDTFAEWQASDLIGFRAGIVVGYRLTVFDFDYHDSGSDIDVDVTLSGPYAGVTLGFMD